MVRKRCKCKGLRIGKKRSELGRGLRRKAVSLSPEDVSNVQPHLQPVEHGVCATSATSKCSKEWLKLFKTLKNTKPILVPFDPASLLRPTGGNGRWKKLKARVGAGSAVRSSSA